MPKHSSAQPLSVYLKSSLTLRPEVLNRSREDFRYTQVERSRGRVRDGPMEIQSFAGPSRDTLAEHHTCPESRSEAFRGPSSEGICRMPSLLTAISWRRLYRRDSPRYTSSSLHG